MQDVRVEIEEQAPARFEVVMEEPEGFRQVIGTEDPYAELVAEAAYAMALEHRIAPLPRGTIRAVIGVDEGRGLPTIAQAARAVAQAILAR